MSLTNLILQNIPFLVLFLGLSLSFFFIFSLYKDKQERDSLLKKRIDELRLFHGLEGEETSHLLVNQRSKKNLDDYKQKLNFIDFLALKLEKAGVSISLFHFISLWFISVSGFFMVGWVFFQFSFLICLGMGFGLGGGFPFMVLTALENHRQHAFLQLFPESLDIMVRGIRSGMSVNRAIEAVSEEMKEPIKSEFRRITDELRVGQTLEVALSEASYRINLDDFRFFAVALIIQRETGGNLSEALSNLSQVIRKRHEMRQKIKALSSEARASALIVGSLPFLAVLILSIMNPDHLKPLIHTSKGRGLMGIACAMMGLGTLAIMRMIRFRI